MTHAMTHDDVPTRSPLVQEQPAYTEDGRRIYGSTLPPSKKIDVYVRFWREDDPEVHHFAARPKLDVSTLRRVGGLMQMAEIQQVREERRRQRAQQRAQAQAAGKPVPDEEQANDALPKEVLDSVGDILGFVGSMMSDRDGVKMSWDPDPTRHVVWGTEHDTDEQGKPRPTVVDHGKDVILPPADTPSWAGGGISIRLPDGTIVPGDDPRVAQAQTLEQASSKRRWHQLIEIDDEVELGLDEIMEIVGDLVGKWAGGEEGGRPLDERASSGTPPTSPESGSGSPGGSPSPA